MMLASLLAALLLTYTAYRTFFISDLGFRLSALAMNVPSTDKPDAGALRGVSPTLCSASVKARCYFFTYLEFPVIRCY